jgi:hypothetical protein
MGAPDGDYLARRMGIGRQCWSFCDQTPCRCTKRDRALIKRRWRKRARRELAHEVAITVAAALAAT